MPLLAEAARMLLGIPASSVTSERAFSKARLIDTRLRAQLGDEIFADLLFIAKNLPDTAKMDEFIDHLLALAEEYDQMDELSDAVPVAEPVLPTRGRTP